MRAAMPSDPRDLFAAARLLQSAVRHEHSSRFEELSHRLVVAEYERLLEQRLELLGRSRSNNYDRA